MPWSKEDTRYLVALLVAFALVAFFVAANFGLVPNPLPQVGTAVREVDSRPPAVSEAAPAETPSPEPGAPRAGTTGPRTTTQTVVVPPPGPGAQTPPPGAQPPPAPTSTPRPTPNDLPCRLLGIC